jgi:hypothetical protein
VPDRKSKTPRRVTPTPSRTTKTPRRGSSNRPTKTPRRNNPGSIRDRLNSDSNRMERNDDFGLNHDSKKPMKPITNGPPVSRGPKTVIVPHRPVTVHPPVHKPEPKTPRRDQTPAKPKTPRRDQTPKTPRRDQTPKTPRRDQTPDIDHNDVRPPRRNHRPPRRNGHDRHPGRGHDHDTTVVNETNVYNDYDDDYYRGGDYYQGGDYYEGDTYYDNGPGYDYDDDYYRGGDYYEGDTYVSSTTTHTSGSVSGRVEEQGEIRGSSVVADPYITLGVGLAGLNAGELVGNTISGTDFNLGLGVKGSLISGEFGAHYGGYAPEDSEREISLFGASIDMRLQPRLGIFEPYALIGAGLHGLSDSSTEFSSTGASLRLGLGADIRLDEYGISARYLHSIYAFDDPNFVYVDGELNATNDQFGVNLLMYF